MLRLERHNDIRLRGNKFCNPFLIILVIDVNLITGIVLAKKKKRGIIRTTLGTILECN